MEIISLKKSSSTKNVSQISKNTISLDGDSICRLNGVGDLIYNYGTTTTSPLASFIWGNALLNQKFSLVSNYAVGGERTDHLLSRLGATLAHNTAYVLTIIGTNDISQEIEVSTIITNLTEIYERIVKNGSIAIISTVIPATAPTEKTVIDTHLVNDFIREYAEANDNIILVDFYNSIVDHSTGYALTDTLSDGTHPSPIGGYLMGKEFAQTFTNKNPHVFSATNHPKNLSTNPYMLGGTEKASGWHSYTGGVVFSKSARDNGLEWQEYESDDGTQKAISFFQYLNNWQVGDIVCGFVEYEVDELATEIDHYSAYIRGKNDANAEICASSALQIASANAIRFPTMPTRGVLYIPKFEILAGVTKLSFQMNTKMKGKFRLGRVKIHKT